MGNLDKKRYTTKINPPTYGKAKSYELYKQEVLTWHEITDLAKEKQGVVIALSLPEDDESQIREKVFSQVKLEDLKNGGWAGHLDNFS